VTDCSAILLAAGRGTRLGFDKILTPLAGKPVLEYSLEVFEACPDIREVIIPTRPDIEKGVAACVTRAGVTKPVRIITGGKERQDSVLEGLRACSSGCRLALIHDSARPLIHRELVEKVIRAARDHGGALCGRPCPDTLKRANDEDEAVETVDRRSIWQVETPQVFSHPDILKAYEHVVGEGLAVTDDASAWESTGRQAQLVDTAGLNLKITRTQDWEVAELWLNREAGRGVRDDLHAINNALSPMTGYLPLLEKQLPAGGTERDYVEKISASLHRTIPLIERLQDKLRELFPVR
jgi:2-C-methyl-D-erythritol 4-phosphate cytidylyltransferase